MRVLKRNGFGLGLLLGASLGVIGCSSSDEPSASKDERSSAEAGAVVVHRTPSCGCCKTYEEYLRRHRYDVESEVTDDLAPLRASEGIPDDAASCHTTEIDGYVVEGHVPVEAIEKLLEERPQIDGIALPGMPTDSPGMGEPGEPLAIVSVTDGKVEPFMTLDDWSAS
jgi:hypothetical protein